MGLVTAGTAAALTHATAGVLAGTDAEKIQRLPNLEGLKNEVIIPRESRNAYDHAVRTLGVKVIEVESPEELRAAISPHTAMIELLGNYFGKANLDLKDIAPIAKPAGIPILVDAAADYLIVPNPYIAQGADLVAYSGGKIIRGPQGAGLLLGRRDLVRAAMGEQRAASLLRPRVEGHQGGDHRACCPPSRCGARATTLQADFRTWESWYAHISDRITKVAGVRAEVQGPIRGGPFPTLNISWDPAQVALTAGEVGRMLLEGEPRIMTQAEGEGHSFLLRPVAMKPGEYEIVAHRLFEVFSSARKKGAEKTAEPPSANIAGQWDVEIQYEVGSARHKLFLAADGNRITGTHEGWAYQGDLKGEISGNRVTLRSSLPADGNVLAYSFTGSVSAEGLEGDVRAGEYGSGKWRARRHGS